MQNYRCWVVWGKKIWIVLLPVALSCVSTGARHSGVHFATSGCTERKYSGGLLHHVGVQPSSQPNHSLGSQVVEVIFRSQLSGKCSRDLSVSFVRMSFCQLIWSLLVLLATRIWYVDRQRAHLAAEAAGSNLTPIVRVILESGAINAATLLAFVITLSIGSQGLEVISEMVSIL